MELLQKALFNLPRATGATGGATAGDISRSRKSYFTFNIQILRNYDTHLHASKIVDNIIQFWFNSVQIVNIVN